MRSFRSAFHWWERWLGLGWAVVLGMWLAGCSGPGEISQGVQLVLSPSTIEATTTFELRFDEPVVASEAVGAAHAPSPLVIEPALPGSFRWLSQRSGVFVPDVPPRLGTVYRLRLSPSWRPSDGASGRARLDRLVRTPGLALIEPSQLAFNRDDAPAMPEVKAVFNAPVSAAAMARQVRFRSPDGGEIPADIRQATLRELFGYRQPIAWPEAARVIPLTWDQRFEVGRRNPTNAPAGLLLEPSRGVDSPVAHAVVILPARALPVGRQWELVLDAGLPSRDRDLRLAATERWLIGDVTAFEVKRIEQDTGLNSGRKVRIELSKPLPPDLAASNVLDWISIDPAVPHLSVDAAWYQIRLRGDFALGTPYRVKVRAGLPGMLGATLARQREAEVSFKPLPPRLYFPDFTPDQLVDGRRELPLLVLNASRVEVKAKQIEPTAIVHALRGYRSYLVSDPRARQAGEDYNGIDYELLPGRTVFTNTFTLTNRVDEATRLPLRWDDLLGPGRRGLVFVEAECAREGTNGPGVVGTQTLVQLTDLGLAWKQAPGETLVYVFSHRTGQGVAAAQVRLTSDENETLVTGVTDATGVARLAQGTNAVWVVAQTSEDTRAANLRENPLSAGSFGVSWDQLASGPRTVERGLLFTDRPVYRPGEQLHGKAILRRWRGGELEVPHGAALRLSASDARDREFWRTNLTVSSNGSAGFEFTLPGFSQGGYHVKLMWGEVEFRHDFLVRDYRPNAFELQLKARPVYAPEEAVEVEVGARYLLGQPLSWAAVDWSLQVSQEDFAPEGFSGFSFGGVSDPRGDRSTGGTVAGHADYRAGTNLVLRPVLPGLELSPSPRRGRLLVEVTDLNQQTLTQPLEFLQHSSAFYLGLVRPSSVVAVGDSVPVTVVAVGANGHPWTNAVTAEVRLERVEWRTLRVESAGRVTGYRYEPEVTLVDEQPIRAVTPVRQGDRWGAEPTADTTRIAVKEPGQYRLTARTRDAGGHAVASQIGFYVHGSAKLAWDYRNETQLELIPDAPRYEPGQAARLLVKAPFDGDALVTVEREGVRRVQRAALHGNAPVITVPIEAGDAPNVFVSVLLIRGSAGSPHRAAVPEFALGYSRLAVDAAQRRLQVVTRCEAEYRPGAQVQAAVEVRNADGQPVPGAEVTLFAVDEGVLSLTGFDTPDPFALFFAGEPLAVETGLTLPRLLPEDPLRLHFQNKGYLVGGGGRTGPRVNFRACAYWNGDLITDTEGRVRAQFTAPDNLTRYRLMAVAHAGNVGFGAGAGSFEINKPLMIEPAVPGFARLGDRLVARAVVLNRTDNPREIEARLRLDATAELASGPAGMREASGRLRLGAQSSATFDVPVTMVTVGAGEWSWNVEPVPGAGSAVDADAVKSPVRVDYPSPLLREVHLARVQTVETNLMASANPQLLEGAGSATVQVATSRLVELGEAAAQLRHYPYGCVEQTTSALLPWLVLDGPGARWLTGTNGADEAPRVIAHGVERLFGMQTQSGGLSYWPGGGEPMLWGSAYATLALRLAAQRGVKLPATAYEALLRYLQEQLKGTGADQSRGTGLSDRCLAAFALALSQRPEATACEYLFEQRARLPESARAWLALAFLEGGGATNRAAELLDTRSMSRDVEADYFSGRASVAGARLLAWLRLQPGSSEIDRTVAELGQSISEGHWGSTQGNAWSLWALADYARRVEKPFMPTTGVLRLAERTERLDLSEDRPRQDWAFSWNGSPPAVVAHLRAEGPSTLFVQTTIEARPRIWEQPRQDRGYRLERAYARLNEANLLEPGASWRVGDRVLVTLTLEARDAAHYVVVDDPLPCLLEAVNPEFRSQETAGVGEVAMDWVSTRHELRSDRAVFFCNHLSGGTYTLRYLARVRAAGSAAAPAAKVEEMYHPERFGLSATGRVEAAAR